ncbi:MAG: hypothetical protein HC819_04470 [Cyclobacteriaceae bacterium]|nr:hypothetical protein [Cyclobacteriaceae bacterium]
MVPADVNLGELKKDVELVNAIQKIYTPIKALSKKLNDSAILASSEAYLPSLAIYNAIKADEIRKKSKTNKVRMHKQ